MSVFRIRLEMVWEEKLKTPHNQQIKRGFSTRGGT